MKYLLSPQQQVAADTFAIQNLGIPSIVLMENAASGSAHCIALWLDEYQIRSSKPEILILCGSGNNGGDGFAIARHLHSMNRFSIRVCFFGSQEKMSEETTINFNALKAIGIEPYHFTSDESVQNYDFHADCIIDAMIGTGGSSEIRGIPETILSKLHNSSLYESALCFAIDLPTGIDGENGKAHPHAFKALGTCTMFAEKVGMYMYPVKNYCGNVEIISLGIPESIAEKYSTVHALDHQDIAELLPKRKQQSTKKDYGRVLIIAGSEAMPGAAALSALAALRSGAGLVEVITNSLHPSMPPEIMPTRIPSDNDGQMNIIENEQILLNSIKKADAIVCGPGLGKRAGEECFKLLRKVSPTVPIIVDADGIPSEKYQLQRNWILTPHGGECSRMTGIAREEIENNPLEHAKEISNSMQCTLHLKSVPPITTSNNQAYLTIFGNPGMASAGSGDVLSGIAGSFSARGIEPLKAMALASTVHAMAGDFAQSVFGQESLTAGDIIASIPHILDGSLIDSWEDEQ